MSGRLTVMDLYQARGLALRRKGDGGNGRGEEWCGPCPGCGGDDRFLVWPKQNDGQGSFACRRCAAAGDAIAFLMQFDGLDFRQAAEAIGRPLEKRQRSYAPPVWKPEHAEPGLSASQPAAHGEGRDEAAWLAQAEHFVATRHEALLKNPAQLAYLAGRGIDLAAVKRFRLGWQEGENGRAGIIRKRSAWGLSPVREANGKIKAAMWIPRGIVIPLERDGAVRRIRIRRPKDDRLRFMQKMKYFVVPGSETEPLFIPAGGCFRMPVCCIVVEAELDAFLVARAAGGFCSVLGLGSAGIRKLPQGIMDALAATPVILVATDVGDASGAGDHAWELWQHTFRQAKRHGCPVGKDPGEMYEAAAAGKKDGHAAIREWALDGLPSAYAERARAWLAEQGAQSAEPPQGFLAKTEAPAQPAASTGESGISREGAAQRKAAQPVGISEQLPQLTGFDFYDLRTHFCTEAQVLEALRRHRIGIRLGSDGDVRLDTRACSNRDFARLLPFLKIHERYFDRIAERMRREAGR